MDPVKSKEKGYLVFNDKRFDEKREKQQSTRGTLPLLVLLILGIVLVTSLVSLHIAWVTVSAVLIVIVAVLYPFYSTKTLHRKAWVEEKDVLKELSGSKKEENRKIIRIIAKKMDWKIGYDNKQYFILATNTIHKNDLSEDVKHQHSLYILHHYGNLLYCCVTFIFRQPATHNDYIYIEKKSTEDDAANRKMEQQFKTQFGRETSLLPVPFKKFNNLFHRPNSR